ncbi:MAG: peptidylprolyl isomerase [Oscillospiraceae bacterium]|nr:peptidylprolyl isomerase [Oscillospiraceae bacterium]
MPKNARNPEATITMENGNKIVFEMYPDKAPNTVCNFVDLAQQGFYDGTIFHRVIQNMMIQGGSHDGNEFIEPGYTIRGEFADNGFDGNDISHIAGTVSMARMGNPYTNSASSGFFICDTDSTTFWNGEYAAFGKVIDGMDEVLVISATETDPIDRPLKEHKIKTVTVDTFGAKYPKPEKYNP